MDDQRRPVFEEARRRLDFLRRHASKAELVAAATEMIAEQGRVTCAYCGAKAEVESCRLEPVGATGVALCKGCGRSTEFSPRTVNANELASLLASFKIQW